MGGGGGNLPVRMDHAVNGVGDDIRIMSLDAEWKGEAKRRCYICGRDI